MRLSKIYNKLKKEFIIKVAYKGIVKELIILYI